MKALLAVLLCVIASPAFALSCWVTEYTAIAQDVSDRVMQVPEEPSSRTQAVTNITTSVAITNAFRSDTRLVSIDCDGTAHYKVSSVGTDATATDARVTTDRLLFIALPRGHSNLKIEFYDGSS